MKRYGLLWLMLAVMTIVIAQLPKLSAQTAPAPPVAPVPPAAGSEVPELPPRPAPPPQPDAPQAGASIGLPSMPGMPGGPGAEYPGQTWAQIAGRQVPHVSRPVDPHVMKLTEEYNKLERQVMQLAHEFRRLPPEGEQREKLQQQIVETTEKQFQLRHEVRKVEIERLQKQLAELEHQLQQREERKKEIIDRRIAQLTNQGDALSWEPLTPPGANPYAAALGAYYGAMPGSGVPNWFPPYGVGTSPVPGPFDPYGAGKGYLTPPPQLYVPYTDAPVAAAPQPREPAPSSSVVEAQARLEIAERDLARIRALHDSATVPKSDLDRAEDAVRLARVHLEDARRDQELKVKMLELELQKGEADLAAAQAELAAIQQQAEEQKDDPGLTANMQRAAATVKQMELDLQRAKVLFERQLQRARPEDSERPER